VRREGGEIDAESAQIERNVRRRLARVEDRERADAASDVDDIGDGRDLPRHVRHVRERDDARPLADHLADPVEGPQTALVDARPAQHGPRLRRKALPRDEVRVMLGLGDDDLVTGVEGEALVAEPCRGVGHAERDHVQRVGRILRPDDLALTRTDEGSDAFSRALEGPGGLARRHGGSAMDRGVITADEVRLGTDHALGTLARRTGIEIDGGGVRREEGEVCADGGAEGVWHGELHHGLREVCFHLLAPT
jgi:hypothetical protein